MQISVEEKSAFEWERFEDFKPSFSEEVLQTIHQGQCIDHMVYSNLYGFMIFKVGKNLSLIRSEKLLAQNSFSTFTLQVKKSIQTEKEINVIQLSQDETQLVVAQGQIIELYHILLETNTFEKIKELTLESPVTQVDFQASQAFVLTQDQQCFRVNFQESTINSLFKSVQTMFFKENLFLLQENHQFVEYDPKTQTTIQTIDLAQSLLIEEELIFTAQKMYKHRDFFFFCGAFEDQGNFYPDIIGVQIDKIVKQVINFTDAIIKSDSAANLVPKFMIIPCFSRDGFMVSNSLQDTIQVIYTANNQWFLGDRCTQIKLNLNKNGEDNQIRGIQLVRNPLESGQECEQFSVQKRKMPQEMDITTIPYPPMLVVMDYEGTFYNYLVLDYDDIQNSKLIKPKPLTYEQKISLFSKKQQQPNLQQTQQIQQIQQNEVVVLESSASETESEPEIIQNKIEWDSPQYEKIYKDDKLENKFQNLQNLKNKLLHSAHGFQKDIDKKLYEDQPSLNEFSAKNVNALMSQTEKNKLKEKIFYDTLNSMTQKFIPKQTENLNANKSYLKITQNNFNKLSHILQQDIYFQKDLEQSSFVHEFDQTQNNFKKLTGEIQNECHFINDFVTRLDKLRKEHPEYKPRRLSTNTQHYQVDFNTFYDDMTSSEDESQVNLDFLSHSSVNTQKSKKSQAKPVFFKQNQPEKVVNINEQLDKFFIKSLNEQTQHLQEVDKQIQNVNKNKSRIQFLDECSSSESESDEEQTSKHIIYYRNEFKNLYQKLKNLPKFERKTTKDLFDYQYFEVNKNLDECKKELQSTKLTNNQSEKPKKDKKKEKTVKEKPVLETQQPEKKPSFLFGDKSQQEKTSLFSQPLTQKPQEIPKIGNMFQKNTETKATTGLFGNNTPNVPNPFDFMGKQQESNQKDLKLSKCENVSVNLFGQLTENEKKMDIKIPGNEAGGLFDNKNKDMAFSFNTLALNDNNEVNEDSKDMGRMSFGGPMDQFDSKEAKKSTKLVNPKNQKPNSRIQKQSSENSEDKIDEKKLFETKPEAQQKIAPINVAEKSESKTTFSASKDKDYKTTLFSGTSMFNKQPEGGLFGSSKAKDAKIDKKSLFDSVPKIDDSENTDKKDQSQKPFVFEKSCLQQKNTEEKNDLFGNQGSLFGNKIAVKKDDGQEQQQIKRQQTFGSENDNSDKVKEETPKNDYTSGIVTGFFKPKEKNDPVKEMQSPTFNNKDIPKKSDLFANTVITATGQDSKDSKTSNAIFNFGAPKPETEKKEEKKEANIQNFTNIFNQNGAKDQSKPEENQSQTGQILPKKEEEKPQYQPQQIDQPNLFSGSLFGQTQKPQETPQTNTMFQDQTQGSNLFGTQQKQPQSSQQSSQGFNLFGGAQNNPPNQDLGTAFQQTSNFFGVQPQQPVSQPLGLMNQQQPQSGFGMMGQAAFGQQSFGQSSFGQNPVQEQKSLFQAPTSHVIGGGQDQNFLSFQNTGGSQSSFLGGGMQMNQPQQEQVQTNVKGGAIGMFNLRK